MALVRRTVRLSGAFEPARPVDGPTRFSPRHPQMRRHRRRIRLVPRHTPERPLGRNRHLRNARTRHLHAAPRHSPARTRIVRSTVVAVVHRTLAKAGHHRCRIPARTRVSQRPLPSRTRPQELLGLQHRRVFRAGTVVLVDQPAERDAHRRAPASRSRYRSDSRRGLQPHLRRQRTRANRVMARPRQRQLLPPDSRR
jgi:hypothetical protein